MKKYIVLSVNDNPDYLFYTPLTYACWNYFGWSPIIFYNGKKTECYDMITERFDVKFYRVSDVPGYRSDTITQVSRLYAGCLLGMNANDYMMTGDIDMIPLSDYWHPNNDVPSIYGHDLTGFGHFPICYIGMPCGKWRQIMNLYNIDHNILIKRDIELLPQAKDQDFYKYWFTDQDLITERIKKYGTDKCHFINRGQYSNGYARGRVDRGAWTLNHDIMIDAHLFHQLYHKGKEDKFNKTIDLLKKVWPQENFDWFIQYYHSFKKLTGHE